MKSLTPYLASALVLLAIFAFGRSGELERQRKLNAANPALTLPCKYSVRDVGFVNVHGKSWYLELIQPFENSDEGEVRRDLMDSVQETLTRSNVNHHWLDADSEQAVKLFQVYENANSKRALLGVLTSPAGDRKPIFGSSSTRDSKDVLPAIKSLIESDSQERILKASANSLCTIVHFESGDVKKDKVVNQKIEQAISKLEKQMWTLEKPVDKPPVAVKLNREAIKNESWIELSLGQLSSENHVAIIYGQARVLGDLLVGEKISIDSIVGRASITGRDCECDLDRDWLYGKQLIHAWPLELERAAETTLNFDPNSSIVQAEVTQIIRKTGTGNRAGKEPPVNLGNGLVIHDLDSLENEASLENDSGSKSDRETQTKSVDQKADPPSKDHANSGNAKNETNQERDDESESGIPWSVLIAVLVAVLAAAGFVMFRGRG